MVKKLASYAALLALVGCSQSKTIEGIVAGEKELNPSMTQRIVYDVPKGRLYTIIGETPEDLYLAIVTDGEDPLNEGDKGQFHLGKRLFSGTRPLYVDGRQEERTVNAYRLEGFELK